MSKYRLGVDIGGTFTDIVLLGPNGSMFSKKILSTPDDYSRAIEEGVAAVITETGVPADEIGEFAHGSTIATNAIIERKGCKVALITTKGFRDVLELGRFRAPRLYDIDFQKPDPLVERRLRFDVPERVSGKGEVFEPVDFRALDEIVEKIADEDIEAVALCFINAYANPENETAAQAYLAKRIPGISVSTSTQLLPQIQEFERTSTTVVNAYIRPVVEGYVHSLTERMRRIGIKAPIMIMQSSGGILPAELAGANPVYVIESGPAAGVVGAQRVGRHVGLDNLMVLDMGGTTAKASLIENGEISIMPETEVGGDVILGHRLIQGGGYPVQVPTIDIAEVGAGGGSIAFVDPAGGIQVGPESAGADPGPVCYDQGGAEPAVTDANLMLGYLNAEALVGGDLRMNYKKAEKALKELGRKINQSVTDTAYGIHMIANASMMRALSGVSSERGRDPSGFTLFAMGGNGGVHAGGLAEALYISTIVVPPVAGVFSALGLLAADVEHQIIRAYYRRFDETNLDDLNAFLKPLIEEAGTLLKSEGFTKAAQRQIEIIADVKYVGQTTTLGIVLSDYPVTEAVLRQAAKGYDEAHMQNYGYLSEDDEPQLVTFKVIGRGISATPRLPETFKQSDERHAEKGSRKAYFGEAHGWIETPVISRIGLGKKAIAGPLIVEEYDTTTVVRPGWSARRDGWNNIVLERTGPAGRRG